MVRESFKIQKKITKCRIKNWSWTVFFLKSTRIWNGALPIQSLFHRFYFEKKFQSLKVLKSLLEEVPIPFASINDQMQIEFLVEELKEKGIRAELDDRAESIGYKIREANGKYKIPVQIIIGKEELENKTVNVRRRGSQEQVSYNLANFISEIVEEARIKFDN